MKPIDYIYKNLHCFNLSIFKQILAESGEEVSESIYDYLMETTWNTNPTFLKQFGLDIVRTKEESGEDEDITILFEKKGAMDNPFFIIDENGNVDKDSKLKSLNEWLDMIEQVENEELDCYLEINELGRFKAETARVQEGQRNILWVISESDSIVVILQIRGSACGIFYVEDRDEGEVMLPINSLKIYTEPIPIPTYTIVWDNSNTSYSNRVDTNVLVGDTIITPDTDSLYKWQYDLSTFIDGEFIFTNEIASYAVDGVVTIRATYYGDGSQK